MTVKKWSRWFRQRLSLSFKKGTFSACRKRGHSNFALTGPEKILTTQKIHCTIDWVALDSMRTRLKGGDENGCY